MVEVIPAILTNNFGEVEEKLNKLEVLVDRVQIDIVDGVFANNKSIDPALLQPVETTLNLDFHLMTKDPINWVEKCIQGNADRIIGQIEKMDSQKEFVNKIMNKGLKPGLALDTETEVVKIDLEVVPLLDVILLMSYPAGFGGQPFDPKTYKKIDELFSLREKEKALFKICIDGGVTIDNIGKMIENGADEVAIGTRLFDGNLEENLDKFRNF